MINKAILLGRVGNDPKMTTFQDGTKAANFSLATNKTWKDKDGNKKEETEWHNINTIGNLAVIAESYVKKGDLLYVEGSIKSRKYTIPTTNEERTMYEIHATEIKLMPKQTQQPQDYSTFIKTAPVADVLTATLQQPIPSAAVQAPTEYANDLPF